MPLKNYGVLVGRVVDHYPQPGGNPHYLVEVAAAGSTYRVAVNLESTQVGVPRTLQYKIDPAFGSQGGPGAALLQALRGLAANSPSGTFQLKAVNAAIPVIDYVRGGLTDPTEFDSLPQNADPEDNTFSDAFKQSAEDAKESQDIWIAVFGTGYPDQDDHASDANPLNASFGFEGVDNIHMNQGNYLRIGRITDSHYYENGPDQDGSVIFFKAASATAFFTKFQSQDAYTDPDGNPVHTGVEALDNQIHTDTLRSPYRPRPEHGRRGHSPSTITQRVLRGRAIPASSISRHISFYNPELLCDTVRRALAAYSCGMHLGGFVPVKSTLRTFSGSDLATEELDEMRAYREGAGTLAGGGFGCTRC